jgi:uncharacterized DUF497 family protein
MHCRYNRCVDFTPVVFDWDGANIAHLARHSVSRQEAEQCYRNDPLIVEEQFINGEDRYLALGETQAARRLAFVFTRRSDHIRFVTAYPMTAQQQEIYEEG